MSTTVPNAAPLNETNLQNANLSLAPQNQNNGPAPIYGVPAWTIVSNTAAADGGTAPAPLGTLTVAADGKSAQYITNGDEAVTITVSSEADPTPGANTLVQSVVVTVATAEAVTPGLTATAVSK